MEYKKRGIELWYVGGNNTKPLLDLPLEKVIHPIFYFCDWDYNGLQIFSRIKGIFNRKKVHIDLLEPLDLSIAIPTNVPHHKSSWKREQFSRLVKDDFTDSQKTIITTLINNDEWIEEESMNLIDILEKEQMI